MRKLAGAPERRDRVVMKRLRCARCGMVAAGSWAFIWYPKEFSITTGTGKPRRQVLWLCPDCAGEFSSDRARNAFLRRAWEGRE